ncbi:signal peptidase II [Tundrisphaera sp. TA3]|uniref:signal peptidase II n=1 Tax=Tundrisphaera sp. TA3 TaxID=3435775 RepID=UPI003EBB5DB8
MSDASTPGPAPRPVPRGHVILFLAIALGGAAFDLATKTYFFRLVGEPIERRTVTVIPNVIELQTSYNTGALWGFMRSVPYSSKIFAVLSILAVGGIAYWLFVGRAATDRRLTVALALITAGALGNCYDRLALGHVRDFVHLHIDPINFECAIFNFADNMLVVGATALVFLALRPEPPPAEAEVASASTVAHTS